MDIDPMLTGTEATEQKDRIHDKKTGKSFLWQ